MAETFALLILCALSIVSLWGWLTSLQGKAVEESASRIGLRDKGEKCSDNDGSVWTCDRCNVRTRIGIDKDGKAHEYCWKCEEVCGEEDAPKEPSEEDLSQVIDASEVPAEDVITPAEGAA